MRLLTARLLVRVQAEEQNFNERACARNDAINASGGLALKKRRGRKPNAQTTEGRASSKGRETSVVFQSVLGCINPKRRFTHRQTLIHHVIIFLAALAQPGRLRCFEKAEVVGSNPTGGTTFPRGVIGSTPDFESGDSWFKPMRGNR